MEPTQIDGPIILASLIVLSILLGSAFLWIRHAQKPQDMIQPEVGVPAWPIGWVNFLIFICVMIIAVFVVQNIGGSLLIDRDFTESLELTPWLAVAAVVTLQVPMLATFYGARRLYPGHYADRLNQKELSTLSAFKQAFPLFIMFMPLIWVGSLVWNALLLVLQQNGIIEEAQPQPLISLFQDGGNVAAISLLALMAVVLAPIVEEIIFRGCIYRFFKSVMTIHFAQLLSGIIFAFMHANLLSFAPLVIVGIVLAKVYEKTGNLAVAIWFHAFFNAFSLSMLYITSLSENIPV